MADDGHRTDGSDDGDTLERGAVNVQPPGLRIDLQRRSHVPGGAGSGSISSGLSTGPSDETDGLAKILPFPRDWFGPVDDLVPVFAEPTSQPVITAASFWDEDAGSVHQVVESLDPRWVGEGGDGELAPLFLGDSHPDRDPERPPDPGLAPESPERVRRLGPAVIVGGGLGLMAVCAAVALLLFTGGLHHSVKRLSAKPAASHVTRLVSAATTTPPQTVTNVATAKTVVRRHRRRVRARARPQTTAAKHAVDTSSKQTSVPVSPVESGRSPAPTPAPVVAAGSGSSAGAGCVQSPDSGCMP